MIKFNQIVIFSIKQMIQIKDLVKQDEIISNQIACAKYLYYTQINNNLECSLDLLQTIISNYSLIENIFKIFKSEEQLNGYIDYLENQSTKLKTNKYVDYLQEIIDSSEDYSFAQSFVDSISNLVLTVDTGKNEEKYSRRFSVSVTIKSNLFDLSLYCVFFDYDDYNELDSYELSTGGFITGGKKYGKISNQNLKNYKQELIEFMEGYNLQIEKIKEFNEIIIKWLIACGNEFEICEIYDEIINEFN